MKEINPNSITHPIAVGYWTGPNDSSFPDPSNFVNSSVPKDLRNKVATYLEHGKKFISYLGYSFCRFNCGIKDYEMGAFCYTDGEYVWPEGLSHYIRIHDIWLPDKFINHILQHPEKDCSLVDLTKLHMHDYSWWKTFKLTQ